MKKGIFFTGLAIALFGGFTHSRAQVAPEGRYIHFNGVDQHMLVPNHRHFNIAEGESFSVSCRIKPENFDHRYTILSKGNLLTKEGRYHLCTVNTGSNPNLALHLYNSENTELSSPNAHLLTAGSWVHVAWVYNSADKTSKVYVDGALASEVINLTIGKVPVTNSGNLTVGCLWTNPEDPYPIQFWQGDMDELRIWKRALTANDALADRTARKPDRNGLVASYDFESLQGNIVQDISGEGHTGVLSGYGIKVFTTQLPVGAGLQQERLTSVRLSPETLMESVLDFTVDLSGTTNLADITALKIFYNGSSERFDPATATLFGSASAIRTKITITGNRRLLTGDNYFWLTADISRTAREGNTLKAGILNYKTDNQTIIGIPKSEGSRTILLTTSLLFKPGDNSSKHYRIPAIVTAKDGSLVTATDRRWNSPHDLPSHIDVLIRRSTDNGSTWSRPLCIAGDGLTTGFGDPALLCNWRNGEIICLFAGNKGFFQSTATEPIRIYQCISSDNGVSWSSPKDITPQVYGAECSNPLTQTWQGAFVSSGSAVQLRSGRIMAVMPVRQSAVRNIADCILYSDDNARTWKVSAYPACTSGNEAKVVELDNNKLLMSIRNGGNRLFCISKDLGLTWGLPMAQAAITDPSCNGDMIRYTSVINGYDKNRLLHTIPYATSRKNVSVLLSYDEGGTWPVRRTIYPGTSAYSSICILNDGTIGMYYEAGEYDIYEMYFARFTLNWLTGGTDTWRERYKKPIGTLADIAPLREGLIAYPNPAVDYVDIEGNLQPGRQVGLYTITGSLVASARVENPLMPVRLPVAGLAPGNYIIRSGTSSVQVSIVSR